MLRNYFTLTQKGHTEASYNTLNNIFAGYTRGTALCKYIYIKTTENQTHFVEAKIVQSNFNPAKGALFCSYSAVLDAIFLQGKTISAVGFCPAPDTSYLTNSAAFNYQKAEGERLVICGTLFLQPYKTNMCFTAGENRLVKAFLGAEDFLFSGYTMAAGTNTLPPLPVNREPQGFAEVKTAAILFTQSAVIFNASFNAPVYEVVLMLNGIPVLRAVPDLANQIKITSKIADKDGYVIPDEDFLTGCSDVLLNYNPLFGYHVSTPALSLLSLHQTDYRLPANATLKGHGTAPYFACVYRGRITLYKSENGCVLPFKWFKGHDCDVLVDGTAIIFGDSIVAYKDGVEIKLNIKSGAKNKAVYYAGQYLIACADSGSLRLNYFDQSLAPLSQTVIDVADDLILLDFLGYALAVGTGSTVSVFMPTDFDTGLSSWLSGVKNYILSLQNPSFQGDRLVFYNKDTNTSSYIDFMDTTLKTCAKTGRICGEFLMHSGGGQTNYYRVEDLNNIIISTPQLTCALAQNGVYALVDDGTLIALTPALGKIKINSSKIKIGDRVGFNLYQKSQAGAAVSLVLTE